MVVASEADTRRTKFIISRIQGDSAITSRFWGAASSVTSLMVATTPASWPASSNIWLVRITTRRSIPLPVCSRTVELGAAGGWLRPTSTPQLGSHTEHWKTCWQYLPSISSLDMPNSFSAARFTPVMRYSGSYRTRASESWSNTDSSTLDLCQPGVSLDMQLELAPIIASRLREFAQLASISGGMPPPQAGNSGQTVRI